MARLLRARERRDRAAAEFYDELVRLRREGITLEAIGAVLGVSRQAVNQMLKRQR